LVFYEIDKRRLWNGGQFAGQIQRVSAFAVPLPPANDLGRTAEAESPERQPQPRCGGFQVT
jgi:hypothetical protein